jgi:pimeloyl-ACP methyl ester carboxylesterase
VGDLLHGHADNLLMTGHSLGAALATLAALDFPTAKLINFGSPLVGDAGFAAQFIDREVARYVHCCDVITRVPLPRFDRQHIMGLFSELGDFHNLNVPRKMAAEVLTTPVALALDLGFRLVVPPVHFQHVAPAKYIRADGEMASEVEASDQQRARTSYTKSHGATWDQLKKLIKAASAPDSAPNASLATRGLRQFIGQLFDLAMDAPVRLRDLADHAPINYVSAFSGRL